MLDMTRFAAAALLGFVLAASGCSTALDLTSSTEAVEPAGASTEPPSPGPDNSVTTTTIVSDSVPMTTTPAPALVETPLVTLPPDTPLCDGLQTIDRVGKVAADQLIETSGIAVSRTYPSVIWAHNDSGGEAIVYALATDGTLLSSHRIGDAFPLDLEDIAIGPGPDPTVDYLYVGDIGDNLHFRPDVLVYRIPEPNPFSDGISTGVEKIRLNYPEIGINSEGMAVDPVTGDLFLFEKTDDAPVPIYVARGPSLVPDIPVALEFAGTLGIDSGSQVTGADVSASGDRIALRGYDEIWVWPRADADLATTLQTKPCRGASPDEVQGEAISFSPDGGLLYTISEGTAKAINQVGP
jgi:hypothetical protein